MSFNDLLNEIQEKVFSRIKNENIDVDDFAKIVDIITEENDIYLNKMCVVCVENYLYDFGFHQALDVYDGSYGLASLEGMQKIRRVRCLLNCALVDILDVNVDQRYIDWCAEHQEEGEREGVCVCVCMCEGELEAGHEGEGEEEEEMEMEPEAEEEEEINLDELLAEIEDLDEDMEEEGMMYDEDMMDENMEEEELEEGLGGFFANLLKGVEQKWLESTHPEEFKAIQAETDKTKKAEMAKPLIQAFMKEMEAAGVAGSAKAAKINELRRVLGIGGAAKGLSGSGFASMSETTELEEELKEAYTTIETLRSELNEVNLLNAKLLYTNKIFKAKTLTENQKLNVLSSFDKALTVKEVKLVYETLSEGLKTKSTKITENFGSASKPVGTPSTKQPIVESDDMVKRFQKLAGII